MPCIQIKTNVEVSQEAAQAVKSALGQSIAHLPGKSEPWLMITLEDTKPLAMVEVKVLGDSVDKAGSRAMTQEICALFQKELGVAPQDMYIRYLATPDWGWNGGNF